MMKKTVAFISALVLILALLPVSLAQDGTLPPIVINELVSYPASGLKDADGELCDWVELHNTTDEHIFLRDYYLSNDPARPDKWQFPDNAILPAYGYYLVFCSGKNKIDEGTNFPHTNFKLGAEGETLVLSRGRETVDRVSFSYFGKSVSYGRDPYTPERFLIFSHITPTQENNSDDSIRADEFTAVETGKIMISEVMTNPDSVSPAEGVAPCDWVEIFNGSAETVDLSGWGLSDNVEKPLKWTFPEGTVLQRGEHKLVLMDKKTNTNDGMLHGTFGLSKSGGESINLSDAAGNLIDRIELNALPADVTCGHTQGQIFVMYYDVPTPGVQNGSGFYGFAKAPEFSVKGGKYDGSIVLSLDVADDCTAYYTVDGSIPTIENGIIYTGPLKIEQTVVIRARCFNDYQRPSDPVTASYIMNTDHDLRVVSVVVEPNELWDPATGMLADGPNAVKVTGQLPFKNTTYRAHGKEEREAYVEVMEPGAEFTTVISQGCLISLQGAYSLDMPQKSMKIKAKADLGGKYFEYPLFDSREFTEYKSFVLRNSGNDCVWTRLIDCFQCELIERYIDTDIITLAYEPCAVYINGQYWGHMNMREMKGKNCIAQHEGLSMDEADGITIIKGNYTAVNGSNTEYKAMISNLKKMSPGKKAADRQYLDENIDVESYLDWFAIEMFFGNSDPGNVMYYKLPGESSKWKCLIFDMDYGMFKGAFDSPKSYMKSAGMGDQKIVNTVFKKILEVPEYKELFYTKIGRIYQTLTTETMDAVLDEMAAVIEPEMMRHCERWAGDPGWKLVNSDTPASAEGMYNYWVKRINRVKNTTRKRPYYIYTLFQKQFKLTNAQMQQYFGGPCPAKPKD